MKTLFEELLDTALLGQRRNGHLLLNMKETEEAFEVLAEVPGLKPEDVNISYEDSYLSIVTSKRETGKWDYSELVPQTRSRRLYLPEVKVEEIEASVENGLLIVKAPKGIKPKTMISVKVK